ncbi:ATP-binding protein [Streptomyces sp. NPDC001941]|uniref:ATP-binding protein n=1 Tax=Streptomyces sp. NPDC001941 TaxID=3154659 RepID=UPI0033193F6D
MRRAIDRRLALAGIRPQGRDEVALVVSELVTNAVLHTQGAITVEARVEHGRVYVTVTDGDEAHPPAPRAPDPDDERGRGLHLVDAVAVDHGVKPVPGGKQVWAVVDTTNDQVPPTTKPERTDA